MRRATSISIAALVHLTQRARGTGAAAICRVFVAAEWRQGDDFNSGMAYSISVALPRITYVTEFQRMNCMIKD